MPTGPGLGLQQVRTCLRLWRRSETAISLLRIVSADIQYDIQVDPALPDLSVGLEPLPQRGRCQCWQQTKGHSAPGSPRGSAPRSAEPQAGPAPSLRRLSSAAASSRTTCTWRWRRRWSCSGTWTKQVCTKFTPFMLE